MDSDKLIDDNHICKGVIKKLFPIKRYGFVVCECSQHTGEAHFNYSDLDLSVTDGRETDLCVGWKLQFKVSKQDRPTGFCTYRAAKVQPVKAAVFHCELIEVSHDLGWVFCRDLGGKYFSISRSSYNGDFGKIPDQPEFCRALITWQSLRARKPYAVHCSQDVLFNNQQTSRRTERLNNSKHFVVNDGRCDTSTSSSVVHSPPEYSFMSRGRNVQKESTPQIPERSIYRLRTTPNTNAPPVQSLFTPQNNKNILCENLETRDAYLPSRLNFASNPKLSDSGFTSVDCNNSSLIKTQDLNKIQVGEYGAYSLASIATSGGEEDSSWIDQISANLNDSNNSWMNGTRTPTVRSIEQDKLFEYGYF